jgi:hypothetical protein
MKIPPKLFRVFVLGVAIAALAVACDLQKTANQISARTVVVATLLSTPAVTIKPEAIAGLDASIPSFDAGAIIFDAGLSFDFRDAGLPLPAQSVIALFLGQRQGDSIDVQPTGVAGAQVTLQQVGGQSFRLNDTGGGNYVLSGIDAGFTYQSNASYQFSVLSAGQTFIAEVVQVPPEERIPAFTSSRGFIDQPAGQPLTFVRQEPAAGQRLNLGFVTVFPIELNGNQSPTPTYTNVPTTPLQFLKLAGDAVGAQTEYRAQSVTIPGTAFPERDRNYIVVFQSAKTGGPKSDNLFSGSAIIAGTAAIGIVKTR